MGATLISAADVTPGVSITGLVKRYGDTLALAGLDLEMAAGAIHGVVGPNGAGKSTLIKILAGEEKPDEGSISIYGDPWTSEVGSHRIAVVHQEAELFPNLTVAENLMAGRESTIGRPRMEERERSVLEEMGLTRFQNTLLGELPLGLQQRTEIGRALVRNADVFLFDEPNSALTVAESEELFAQMRQFADLGRAVLFVTHRVEELATMADAVTVVVDGKCRTTLYGDDVTEERIARELVFGAIQHEREKASDRPLGEAGVQVNRWTHAGGKFKDVTLNVGKQEVVAVVGVEGSGGRELVRSLVRLEKAEGRTSITDYDQVEFVAANRSESLFSNLSVAENLYIRQNHRIRNRWGLIRFGEAVKLADTARTDFAVKTATLNTPIRSLSGGNQQKVAIASALAVDPALIVVEEPSRGVDIASKAEIYRLLRDYAGKGGSVLIYCTEISEVFAVADRVVVVSRGRVVDSIDVRNSTDVETLAAEITALESYSEPQGG